MILEQPAIVSNAMLSPFLKGSNKRMMLIARSDYSHLLVHYHNSAATIGAKISEQDVTEPAHKGKVLELESAIYGGILFHNFGHFLTESIHRLWPLLLDNAHRAKPILFHVPKINSTGEYFKPFMIEILDYLGVDWQKIIIIDRPTRIGSLVVAKQAKILGAPAIPGYNEVFKKLALQQPQRPARHCVYVSRTRFLRSGSYIGETFVERRLKACGFDIHYPELVPLQQTLELYRAARNIVFSEGSAVHTLEIIGHTDANVLIVGRRHRDFINRLFIEPLKDCCKTIDLHGMDFAITPLHWDEAKDRPTISMASSVIDLNGLLRKIADMTGVDIPEFTETEIADAIMIDVYKTLFQGPIHPELTDERVGKLIRLLKADLTRMGL